MKILFIDHETHLKTNSTAFLVDLLKKRFNVVCHYYKKHYRANCREKARKCDLLLIFEFPLSRRKFFAYGKKNVFVPMYDNEWQSFWQWKRIAWSGMGVISFCGKVSGHARRCGVDNLLDARYFPDAAAENLPMGRGETKKVFAWERNDSANEALSGLFPGKLGYEISLKRKGEFTGRAEYLEDLSKHGIFAAPRKKEGIGMAFLEAMAMEKCVVAFDDATMNEYITDGRNGILFGNGRGVRPVDAATARAISENMAAHNKVFLQRWMEDKERILDFVAAQKACRPPLLNRIKIFLSYPLFLAEGALMVLKKRILPQ